MSTFNTLRSYLIRSNPWAFRETPERIDYHIEKGDYLPLLATVMGFMEEALRNNDSHETNARKTEIALKLACELRADLRYVSAHYKLESKKTRTRKSL